MPSTSRPLSPRDQRDPKLEPFQLRVVNASLANQWWKVLCRSCETIGTVRERLVKATSVKSAMRLYHNGVLLDEKKTLEDLNITVDSILSTGRTQSVVFGAKGMERIMNDAAVAVTPRGSCCTTTDAGKPIRTAPSQVTRVNNTAAGAAAVSAFRHQRRLAASSAASRGAPSKKAQAPTSADGPKNTKDETSTTGEEPSDAAASATTSPRDRRQKTTVSARYVRRIRTPCVPLDTGLFVPDKTQARPPSS